MLRKGLLATKLHSDDESSRLDCQVGAWLAATGVNRVNFGASHGIGHVVGAALGVPHGITSCVLLPTVLRYNAEAIGCRQTELAAALGDTSADPGELLTDLIASLGLPARLRDVGVLPEHFDELSRKAMDNPWVRTNPRRIDRPEQVQDILRAAW
ncbi:Alcohol dehydrogenase 2 [compost metagenome]